MKLPINWVLGGFLGVGAGSLGGPFWGGGFWGVLGGGGGGEKEGSRVGARKCVPPCGARRGRFSRWRRTPWARREQALCGAKRSGP